MKNLIIIVVGALMLVAILFSCRQTVSLPETKNENNISVLCVDSLKGKYLPVELDWNERILAVFIDNANTCEITIGYITAKFSALSTFAHRKVLLIGKNGHWDINRRDIFVFNDGLRMKLVPSYPVNSASPMPPISKPDKRLHPVDEVPARQ